MVLVIFINGPFLSTEVELMCAKRIQHFSISVQDKRKLTIYSVVKTRNRVIIAVVIYDLFFIKTKRL